MKLEKYLSRENYRVWSGGEIVAEVHYSLEPYIGERKREEVDIFYGNVPQDHIRVVLFEGEPKTNENSKALKSVKGLEDIVQEALRKLPTHVKKALKLGVNGS